MAGITRYNNYDRSFIRPFEMLDEIFSALPIGTLATYAVNAELPGVTREQIDVELNEGNLSITINKKEVEEEKGKNYLLKETGEWTATRSIYLKDAAIEGLSAKLEDGVLSINVPKLEAKVSVTKVNID